MSINIGAVPKGMVNITQHSFKCNVNLGLKHEDISYQRMCVMYKMKLGSVGGQLNVQSCIQY